MLVAWHVEEPVHHPETFSAAFSVDCNTSISHIKYSHWGKQEIAFGFKIRV
jgi:hypothetical protein